jgi:hypothetical protein
MANIINEHTSAQGVEKQQNKQTSNKRVSPPKQMEQNLLTLQKPKQQQARLRH